MESATPEEAFRYCLENPENLSTEQLLDKFPQHREELRVLLALDRRLSEAMPQRMSLDANAAIKQKLLLAAEARKPINTSAVAQSAEQNKPAVRERRVSWARRIAWAFSVIALLVGATWFLAARSLPDSPFYGIKLAAENFLLSFTGEPAGIVRGHIGLANTRLVDLRSMNTEGKLAQAEPSFSNYSEHLKAGVSTWRGLGDSANSDLDKLLYTSSVAGQQTFRGFGGALNSLPPALQVTINQTIDDLGAVSSETTQKLQADGVDLDQVLRESSGELAALLTPVVGASPLPTSTPIPDSTATALPLENPTPVPASSTVPLPMPLASAVSNEEATRVAVLYIAQTVIAEGGSAETPVVAAAETVMAGVTGTALIQAQQTVISGWPTSTPSTPMPTGVPPP